VAGGLREDGERRQCSAATEEKMAAKLESVKVRLEADAPGMRQPGAALIAHYLDPNRLPASKRCSRKHRQPVTTKMTARTAVIIPLTWVRLQCSDRRSRAISTVPAGYRELRTPTMASWP